MDGSVMPMTLDWLIAGSERKTRSSACQICRGLFRHGRSWQGACPTCVAKELDSKNAVGLERAVLLKLPDFEMYRRPGDYAVHCRWVCQRCGHVSRRVLASMQDMTAWKASCPSCVREPRYVALANARCDNLFRLARKLATVLGLDIVEISRGEEFPQPRNIMIRFSCLECKDQRVRTLLNLSLGRGCSCTARYSKGETAVAAYLRVRGIPFFREYSLSRLGFSSNLRFDFYIDRDRLAIEYDGLQHFEPVARFGGEEALRIRQANDKKKDDIAAAAGLRILRVPYHCVDIFGFLSLALGSKYGN